MQDNLVESEEDYLEDLARRQRAVWPAGLPTELEYPFGERPLTEYLQEWARTDPDRVLLVFYGTELTFGQVDDLSDRFAGFLLERGVSPGDRVAVMLPNCPQFVIAFYGILKAGAVHVPVNPLFKGEEIVYELQDTEAALLLVWDELLPLIETLRDRTSLQHVVTTGLDEYLPESPTLPVPPMITHGREEHGTGLSWQDVLDARPPQVRPHQDLDALAALNYTGGTTGLPKGCEHTQRHMIYTAACAARMRGTGPENGPSVSLVFIPVFWIAGEDVAVILPVFTGTTCVLLARWDPQAVLAAVPRYGVSGLGATVDNYVELMEQPDIGEHDLSSVIAPGAMSFVKKLTVAHRRRWQQVAGEHSVLRESAYGMTETHTIDTFVTGFQDGDRDLHSEPVFCGLPMPGTELKVVDFDTGALVPLGAEGEICVRSPSLLSGYWRRPDATAAALRDGWLHTGDIGRLDEDGCLHFLGRRKEMLKVNGMSVFPSELEVILGRHPDIVGSAVIGMPDEERGERAVAFVRLAPPAAGRVTEADLTAWCRENMATYKVPAVRVVEEFPLTATGKVKKDELRRCAS
ncbi:AMP-binding protein [Pseudonocardia nigra]|uniref:AMP-binding protein n=1 Tax=Pseudonocardia nigra TaxID=1921578 RepID=UPI0027E32C3E|nr:AMP-binding protein [Pseudonocardia nigra]